MSNIEEVRKALEILKDFIDSYEHKKKKRINLEEKEFKIVYNNPNLTQRKQRNHYTNNLNNWIYCNHRVWAYYPDRYFPIEIYDKERKLIATLNNANEVYEFLKRNK